MNKEINKMTPSQIHLYKSIYDFQLDNPEAVYPFSYKLAWEYQWTEIYTCRVIQEYKRFIFLAMVADHIVSPSTNVDRVWHLHLLYTHSYWDEFCGKVLKKTLHHSPSLGGKEEGVKYRYCYQKTLNSYQQYFGTPPADIWHRPRLRGEKSSCHWCDRNHYWIIPKPNFLSIN